ncbi:MULTISPECIES: RES family NAD+ phosphorylase [unclassified Bradyrhizobium]|uniref:RES family NAD+ phosphorylase n=1 Tax=unclassified Bradyrhizobium TaxID=2631580 RepID=UPI001FFA722E|nr:MULTISPECIES: RES family NAD+ phosphorylase [unclassified Bradyrhizobium]MCK1304698.1 RES family NAD+ phosphorylase [Bradyrhizobium sp. 45]MCK1608583.1 RES family NAD+ phosphorylase [Bradyrhizobium sp. 163]MCK1766355.1 RES family NAD+ phosphorylase [Bradyrhizobium sp. 136]
MSSDTWTPEELSSNAAALTTTSWRLVEAQHQASTMKVTDTLEEQEILENLIEETKPPVPSGCEALHFLLMTPFRYSATNPNGSRFRRPNAANGVFYTAEHPGTAIAEMSFYRVLFFAESPGTSWPQNPGEYTAFAVGVAAERTLDLTASPYIDNPSLYHLVDYTAGQAIADGARQAGIDVIKYSSVRDPEKRPNLAILTPKTFAKPEPVDRQSWKLHLDANGVRAVCEAPHILIAFDRHAFSADPRLKNFIWTR